MTGWSAAGGIFSVVILCTANICRSPVAEARLRVELGADADVHVSSAGFRAHAGQAACPTMAEVSGVPLIGCIARQVEPDLLRRADLVLTMTRAHRAAAVDLAPATVRRTFTLLEFADLAHLAAGEPDMLESGSPGRRLAALTAAAPRFRARRVAGVHDDIEDPHTREQAAYEQADADVRRAVALVGALAGNGSRTTPGAHSA